MKAKTKSSNCQCKNVKLSDLDFLEVEEDEAIKEEQIIRGVYRENVRRKLAKLNGFFWCVLHWTPNLGVLRGHWRSNEQCRRLNNVQILARSAHCRFIRRFPKYSTKYHVRTFSLRKVRENCHFLDHPPTTMTLHNIKMVPK